MTTVDLGYDPQMVTYGVQFTVQGVSFSGSLSIGELTEGEVDTQVQQLLDLVAPWADPGSVRAEKSRQHWFSFAPTEPEPGEGETPEAPSTVV
jgi:hypothetical protein